MRRIFALPGGTRTPGKSATTSCACLAFVLAMAVAFWAGVLWIGENLMALFFGA
jgi:hypothetical protein